MATSERMGDGAPVAGGGVGAFSSPHWTEGGTGLTNFHPKQAPIYLAAIEKFGDPNYAVSSLPMAGGRPIPTDYSLHHFGPRGDKSSFWRVFREVRDAALSNIEGGKA